MGISELGRTTTGWLFLNSGNGKVWREPPLFGGPGSKEFAGLKVRRLKESS